jgi:2-hydroxychromene-2-carboxylate isomerase
MVLEHIGAECASVGLPFRAPSRIPNTRRALETVEVVRSEHPEVFATVDDAFYRAQWVDGADLGDPAVIDAVLVGAGLDAAAVGRAREQGVGAAALAASMAEAVERGVTGTPAWWVDDRLLIPGVQDRDTVERWVGRLLTSGNASPGGR